MVSTGPLYPSANTSPADWTTPNNIRVEDGSYAQCLNIGPGGSNTHPNSIGVSGFGFGIPSSAVIDGIVLEAKVQNTGNGSFDNVITIGTGTKSSTSTPNFGQSWPSTLTWLTWGSSSSLWGRTDWAASDINNSSFGAHLLGMPNTGSTNISIDAVRITVYWHPYAASQADVPKRYQYKVYAAGVYQGNLPYVTSEFNYSNDINSVGSQITVTCGYSVDTTALQGVMTIDDESGNPILDENGQQITSEGTANIVAPAPSNALIRNGNKVIIVEESFYNPSGKIVFRGTIERWHAKIGGGGGSSDAIEVLIYADSSDLDNYILTGPPFAYTSDVSQTSQNAGETLYTASDSGGWYRDGQSFKVGVGVTNLGAISLLLNGSGTATVSVYTNADMSTGFLASATVSFDTSGAGVETQFAFASRIAVTAGTTYYFNVVPSPGSLFIIYYSTANPYADGSYYNSSYSGGGGGSYGANTARDLYFKTFSSNGNTTATFTSQDPSTGMLAAILDDYNRRGGLIGHTSSSIVATGLTLTYTFNTNTVLEGLKAILSLAPNGFYYYVDMGTNTLYFKQASTSADIIFQYANNVELDLSATIENVTNQVYFTGGIPSGSSTNLYRFYQDTMSMSSFGPRLDRKTDNRVTVSGTADAIGNTEIASLKDEKYETTLTVTSKVIDISTLHPGLIVGFRGYGSFIDNLLLQIVRVDLFPEKATLILGILPKRLNPQFEYLVRNLIALSTVANPTTPS